MASEAVGLCRNGHDLAVLGRSTKGECKACVSIYHKAYRAEHGDSLRAQKLAYHHATKGVSNLRKRAYRQDNLELVRQQEKAGYQRNRTKRIAASIAYHATVKGQLAHAKAQNNYELRKLNANIAMLEEQLNASS